MLDVAITGSGIVSALGCGADRFHRAMMAGESAIREAPWHNGGQGRPNWWAIVRDFNPRDWMEERIESGTDMFAQFALAAARQAIEQAAIGQLDGERTGVVHGTSIGGARALMKAQVLLDTRGPHEIPRKTEIDLRLAASPWRMVHGPSLTVTAACASSLVPSARPLTRSPQARRCVIAGGTEGGLAAAGGLAEQVSRRLLHQPPGMVAPSMIRGAP